MKVSFTFDINDLHEIVVRSSRGKFQRPWDRILAEIWALCVVIPVAAWGIYGIGYTDAYPFVLTGLGMAGILAQWYTAQTHRTRIFDYLEFAAGGMGPFRCEVELGPEGITTRQFGEEIRRPWQSVEGVSDTASGVEIDLGRRGLIIVRGNAFADASERETFVGCVASYIADTTRPEHVTRPN